MAEYGICELRYLSEEITSSTERLKWKMRLRETEDRIKMCHKCVVGVPEWRKRENGGEALFKVLIALTFQKLIRDVKPQI